MSLLSKAVRAGTAGMMVSGFLLLVGGAEPASATKTVAVPVCSPSSLVLTVGKTGAAAGTEYTNLRLTNHSGHACFIPPVSSAQSVVGRSHTPVGLPAGKLTVAGRGRGVILVARKGVASVEYAVGTALNYPSARCIPRYSNGVLVTFTFLVIKWSLYFPRARQLVCTKLVSTSISGVALGTHYP